MRVRGDLETKSTKPELHLEICSSCHPFFTGRQKLLDTEGRVQRFTRKFGAQTVAARKAREKPSRPRTLRRAKDWAGQRGRLPGGQLRSTLTRRGFGQGRLPGQ